MANKANDAKVQEMLRKNYMSSSTPEPEAEPTQEVKADIKEEAVEKPVVAEKKKSPGRPPKEEKSQLNTTTIRLPEGLKRAIDLYKIDERARRGAVTTNQIVLEALLQYIPDKYFD